MAICAAGQSVHVTNVFCLAKVFSCSTCANTYNYVSQKTRHQILCKKFHRNSAIERTIYVTMEKYLITSSVVGKNKIQKLVFFWMMHGLYVIGL